MRVGELKVLIYEKVHAALQAEIDAAVAVHFTRRTSIEELQRIRDQQLKPVLDKRPAIEKRGCLAVGGGEAIEVVGAGRAECNGLYRPERLMASGVAIGAGSTSTTTCGCAAEATAMNGVGTLSIAASALIRIPTSTRLTATRA